MIYKWHNLRFRIDGGSLPKGVSREVFMLPGGEVYSTPDRAISRDFQLVWQGDGIEMLVSYEAPAQIIIRVRDDKVNKP